MKNVMVANIQEKGRYSLETLVPLLQAQIENSLEAGWEPEDIYLITNWPFEFMGVKGLEVDLPQLCLTGSKMFGVEWLFLNGMASEIMWAHDLDAWQNVWFDPPVIGDVGITTYSQRHRLNGGSVFWSPEAEDIVISICDKLRRGETKEEPTIEKLLFSSDYRDRVTILDHTYNVGCSGFVIRAQRASKPIRVAHFNPPNRISWDTHALDRNKVGIKSVGYRLEKLLRKYYPSLEVHNNCPSIKVLGRD